MTTRVAAGPGGQHARRREPAGPSERRWRRTAQPALILSVRRRGRGQAGPGPAGCLTGVRPGQRQRLPRAKSAANVRAIEARIECAAVMRPSSRLRVSEVAEKFSEPMNARALAVP